MENKDEDEVRKRWEQEARDKEQETRPRKRLREIEYNTGASKASYIRSLENSFLTPDETDLDSTRGGSAAGLRRSKGKKGDLRTSRATRAKGKVTEIPENDEEYIELD